jgi:hypothetical protein
VYPFFLLSGTADNVSNFLLETIAQVFDGYQNNCPKDSTKNIDPGPLLLYSRPTGNMPWSATGKRRSQRRKSDPAAVCQCAGQALIEAADIQPFFQPFDGFQMYARYAMAYWCLSYQIVDAFYCTELPG